jgi:hypothetical protein
MATNAGEITTNIQAQMGSSKAYAGLFGLAIAVNVITGVVLIGLGARRVKESRYNNKGRAIGGGVILLGLLQFGSIYANYQYLSAYNARAKSVSVERDTVCKNAEGKEIDCETGTPR